VASTARCAWPRSFWPPASARVKDRPEEAAKARSFITEALNNQLSLAEKAGILGEVCRRHFSDLASGVWRQRTPKVYKLIEEAPQ
jgi:hypothetical protein